ncbi:hypothetical protein [Actinoplanes auranticolor]|uniref:hypothetical protein n=1 Tax=Actinoplanes auranticolor TaxID=47988 RepID=UPI001FE852EA|nr:hypothetical protein [Actinoplanes auranticolor]
MPDDDAYAGRNVVEDPPGTSTGAGGERSRYELWGSAAARHLGAWFLPQLADITEENRGNLQIAPGQIDAFAQECALLAENVEQLSTATGYRPERVLNYLTTMRQAAERAKAINGGVIIW